MSAINNAMSSTTPTRSATTRLVRAREMLNFSLSDERIDVRGWPVYASDATPIGWVDSLFVDMRDRSVRYLGVALLDETTATLAGTVLVPVGTARRQNNRGAVTIGALTGAQLASAPRLPNRPITCADEDAALAAYGMVTSHELSLGASYCGAEFEERRLLGETDSMS